MQNYTTELEPQATEFTAMPLVERIDPAIGEASTVIGAMLTELVRRSLRGGVMKIDEEIHGFVGEKVDAAVAERRPHIERAAAEVAEVRARSTAAAVAGEQVQALERRTWEATRDLAHQIEETDKRAVRQIEETKRHAEEKVVETARTLSGRIEEAERKTEEKVVETARSLTGQIEETQKRVGETAQEIQQRVEDLWLRSRKGAARFKSRLEGLETTAGGLGQQLQAERDERHAALADLRGLAERKERALLERLEQAERERDRALSALRAEAEELRRVNEQLMSRVAELEKPRGLRRLWHWMFRRKPKAAEPTANPEPAVEAQV